jgi:hypothetical protein
VGFREVMAPAVARGDVTEFHWTVVGSCCTGESSCPEMIACRVRSSSKRKPAPNHTRPTGIAACHRLRPGLCHPAAPSDRNRAPDANKRAGLDKTPLGKALIRSFRSSSIRRTSSVGCRRVNARRGRGNKCFSLFHFLPCST